MELYFDFQFISGIFCLIMSVSVLKEKIQRPHRSYSLLPKCVRDNLCEVSKTMAKARPFKKKEVHI